MAIVSFPPHELADESGLLAVGGDLEVESLVLAYSSGIFPWPVSTRYPLTWFSPPERTIIPFDELHISRSLRRRMRSGEFIVRCNMDFEGVIRGCAKTRRKSRGTWITPAMERAYVAFHHAGFAHSIECYTPEGELVGGVYGVCIGGMFAGESMFHLKDDASKVALAVLCQHLQAHGGRWLDCQQYTPLVGSFGAREIPREEFLELLKVAIAVPPIPFPKGEQIL